VESPVNWRQSFRDEKTTQHNYGKFNESIKRGNTKTVAALVESEPNKYSFNFPTIEASLAPPCDGTQFHPGPISFCGLGTAE